MVVLLLMIVFIFLTEGDGVHADLSNFPYDALGVEVLHEPLISPGRNAAKEDHFLSV